MRVDNYIHIRHIKLYHFEKGWTAAQSLRDLNELFGEETISHSQVEKWFKRFKSGNTSLEDVEVLYKFRVKKSSIIMHQPNIFGQFSKK
jgi:hypothetical protein